MADQSTGYYFNDPVQKCSQLRRNLSWGMLAIVATLQNWNQKHWLVLRIKLENQGIVCSANGTNDMEMVISLCSCIYPSWICSTKIMLFLDMLKISQKIFFLEENNCDEKMKHLLKYSWIFYSSKTKSSKLNNNLAKTQDGNLLFNYSSEPNGNSRLSASDNIAFWHPYRSEVGIRNCTKPCWVSGRVSNLINRSYKKSSMYLIIIYNHGF
jgi:hypothetical protein